MVTTHPEPGGARKLDRFFGRPLALQALMDVLGLLAVIAAFANVDDPDVVLHLLWIVLALQAFAFGLWVSLGRIVVATLVVVLYAELSMGSATPVAASLKDLDLEEWPLMVMIALLVAVMAGRVTATGRRYASLYRQAGDRLLTAQEDERRRLAADLHDGVGQMLTALSMRLDAIDRLLLSADPSAAVHAAREPLARARELTEETLDEVRGVALRLRPQRLSEIGLVAALGELAGDAGVPVEFEADPRSLRPGLLSAHDELEAYRVVQEAFGNAVRHGRPAHIALAARIVHDRQLRLQVRDDGLGFSPARRRSAGLGLAGMEERAASIGAQLTIDSIPGRGALVRLDIPLAPGVLEGAGGERPGDRGLDRAVAGP